MPLPFPDGPTKGYLMERARVREREKKREREIEPAAGGAQ